MRIIFFHLKWILSSKSHLDEFKNTYGVSIWPSVSTKNDQKLPKF